jgi:hypothetical protein
MLILAELHDFRRFVSAPALMELTLARYRQATFETSGA